MSKASAAEIALHRQVTLFGPISVAEYMALSAFNSQSGYYRDNAPIGANGDFITAPEISQMFGELLGLWCIDAWEKLGKPDPFLLVEFGPGRGTLIIDLLRSIALRKDFVAAMRLHLVEINLHLQAEQQVRLEKEARLAHPPFWHSSFYDLPIGPAIFLGNEFLDVFPIHQFERTKEGWKERAIGISDERLCWTYRSPGPHLGLLSSSQTQAKPGEIVEVSPGALHFIGDIAKRLIENKGIALFIDYGRAKRETGASLQAIRNHNFVDPLDHFGSADLTALVDFARMAEAALETGAKVNGPVTQGDFLIALGIEERAAALSMKANESDRKDIASAKERLIGKDKMGDLFKVIAIAHPAIENLAGF